MKLGKNKKNAEAAHDEKSWQKEKLLCSTGGLDGKVRQNGILRKADRSADTDVGVYTCICIYSNLIHYGSHN